MHGDFIYNSQDKNQGDMSWRMKVTNLEVRLHFWMWKPYIPSRNPVPDKGDNAELQLIIDFHLQTANSCDLSKRSESNARPTALMPELSRFNGLELIPDRLCH